MDRPAQLVYEGTRSFRKYDVSIEIVVINLFKFGVFEVLLRDQESQCALPPVYLRSTIIEHRIRPDEVEALMTNSRQTFDPNDLMNDDDLYDLVVRISIFNFIADRLSIKKRALDSTEMYEVEYLPALFDPEFGNSKEALERLVCNDPYYWGPPAPLEKNLSKQVTTETTISTSVRGNQAFAQRNAPFSIPSSSVSLRVNSALRSLTSFFGSGKSSQRSVRPLSEGAKCAPSAATASQSKSCSQSQSKSRSESEDQDPSDVAVHRAGSHSSFKTISGSNKEGGTSTKKASSASAKQKQKQQYHESISGRKGQDLANRMLSRLENLPDIPDELLGTVIYFPTTANTNAGHARNGSLGGLSSSKTVSQDRLAAYFQPLPVVFRSIEDLCDPRVIARIPYRLHPCLQPPKCVSSLSVEVFSGDASTQPDSTKTEAYNFPTDPLYPVSSLYGHTTSPQLGSPCMSIQEDEEQYEDMKKSTSAGAHNPDQKPPQWQDQEGQVAFIQQRKPGFEAGTEENSRYGNRNDGDTNHHHSNYANSHQNHTHKPLPQLTVQTQQLVASEGQMSRAMRPLVSLFRNALQRPGRVGAAPADE